MKTTNADYAAKDMISGRFKSVRVFEMLQSASQETLVEFLKKMLFGFALNVEEN